MTPHEALAEGRLRKALAIQEEAVATEPDNPAARRFLIDLLAFAGRFDDALSHLSRIRVQDPDWPQVANNLRQILIADRARSVEGREPRFIPQVEHAVERWRAILAIRGEKPDEAIAHIDRADAISPPLRGFLNGQEFEGLHDTDDRFASIMEAIHNGEYTWFAWEALRKVTISQADVLMDQLYRPATITLKAGEELAVHLPLVYPDSHTAEGDFALGTETDHISPDGGPVRGLGGKLLLIGDAVEVPLRECRMIEIR